MLVYAYDKSNVAYVSGENSFTSAKTELEKLIELKNTVILVCNIIKD